ncbi:MAG: urease accessory protein UreE [Chromatiaceae bacterium]|nr:urease accessory protein UreE [Chromatiaceae bacterium]MCP5314825.1 urease accessory protein UreE [Chromatiaceae bacterium]
MREFIRRAEQGEYATTLTLPLEKRIRSRLRVTLDDGSDAGVFLERGEVLRDGDLLATGDGFIVCVRAAAEPVSEARCDDPLLLARACYHLGNRHVELQIGDGVLRYRHDHVLDDMLRGLGLNPSYVEAPFEPEPGAYGGSAHAHAHAHAGDADHVHAVSGAGDGV